MAVNANLRPRTKGNQYEFHCFMKFKGEFTFEMRILRYATMRKCVISNLSWHIVFLLEFALRVQDISLSNCIMEFERLCLNEIFDKDMMLEVSIG
jgi:hypothetical protein